jgi:hyperosmotically inducible periplasmic protein
MSRIQATRWIIPAVATLGLTWAYAGRAQEPSTAQKVGEKIDGAVQDIKGGLRKAGDATREQFAKVRTGVHNMGVESRVYGRIHWDKALNDASIELTATDDGVITLNGTVADAKAKTRAVDLTRETVGVSKVIDQLAVRPTPSTTTTRP